jgi:hypothetical protein
MSADASKAVALEPAAFAAHPALPPLKQASVSDFEASGTNIPWTLDMDDMLRTGVRRNEFDFEAASKHIQGYILRLRACGGILPDEVVEPLYTAKACRERWARIDFMACQAFRRRAAGEELPAPPVAANIFASAPPAQRGQHGVADDDDDDDEVLDDDGEDDESSDDDNEYGIVNLDALRAQRLGGLFGAAPSHRGAVREAKEKSANGGGRGAGSGGRQPAAAPSSAASAAGGRGRGSGAPPGSARGSGEAAADFGLLAGRSQQLAELEQLAAELSSPKEVGFDGGGGRGAAAGAAASSSVQEHHREAATALLEPLGDLKKRMEGLEALLADEATDMAAKLGEVAQVHREMAELQTLAQQCHSVAPTTTAAADGSAGGAGGSQPLRFAPATGGVNLEAALDGLDIDGMLARLEAEHEAQQ